MKDQRFYIATSIGKKLAIINETAAQFTVKGCPQWARPDDIADAVRSSPAFFELGVGVLSAGDLDRSKHGRAALRHWHQGNDSVWRIKARAQSQRDVGLNLERLRDEGGDAMAGVVLEEGSLEEQVRYSLKYA